MRIGIIGAGVMGSTIAESLIQKNVARPGEVMISDTEQNKCSILSRQFGIQIAKDNQSLTNGSDVIILAIKPQTFPSLSIHPPKGSCILSIMAGVTMASMQNHFGHTKIIRSMPNLCAKEGLAYTVWIADPSVSITQKAIAQKIFRAFGKESEVMDETLIDAATAVTGSGPGYLFYIVEALHSQAVAFGFTSSQADEMISELMKGTVAVWEHSQDSLKTWYERVCSKGGTTEAALSYFTEQKLQEIIKEGMRKALARAKELSQ